MDSSSDLFRRLEQLNAIGAALSKGRDINRLLESILIAAKTITHADGGTLYRMTEDGRALRFEILRTDSLHIAMGGTTGNAINFPNLPLQNAEGKSNDSMVAAYAAIHDKTVNIADAYTEAGFDFSGTREFRRAHRLSLAVFPHGADEEPRGRDHRRAATHQRPGSGNPPGHPVFLGRRDPGRITLPRRRRSR